MSKKRLKNTPSVEENPLFHDTWKLLKNYRDAVWNLSWLSSRYATPLKSNMATALRNFFDSIYLAGADIGGTRLENYAKSIERSNKMLNLLNSAVDILRSKHKHGEQYYWILYYSYLSPQQLQNTDEIIESLIHTLQTFPNVPITANVQRLCRHSVPSSGGTPQRTVWRCLISSFRITAKWTNYRQALIID